WRQAAAPVARRALRKAGEYSGREMSGATVTTLLATPSQRFPVRVGLATQWFQLLLPREPSAAFQPAAVWHLLQDCGSPCKAVRNLPGIRNAQSGWLRNESWPWA